jgi:hypothetical protein
MHYSKKQHITRKAIIICLAFAWWMISTVLAAAVYDANIQSRATAILATIDSNASAMDPMDVVSYYTLVHMNIESLMQVLSVVDSSLTEKLSIASNLDGTSVTTQTSNTGFSNTGTVNIDTRTVVTSTWTTHKKSCKLIKKESMFEGDNNGYGFEGIDGWFITEHLSGYSDGNDGFVVDHGGSIRAMRVSGKNGYDRTFRCNDGVPEYSWTEGVYNDIFCNDPNYTVDGFTVRKMLKKSGPSDLNGWYQYFKMNVGETYRQAYAKCDQGGKIVILDKKEYPKSWNCERWGVVDGITVPKFIRPDYYPHAANDSYDFLDSYFLDGQSSETLKTSSQDGYAYDIKVTCNKWAISIIEKVQGELDQAHKDALRATELLKLSCKTETIDGYEIPETKQDGLVSVTKQIWDDTYAAQFSCEDWQWRAFFKMMHHSCAPIILNWYSIPVIHARASKIVYKKVGNDVHHAEVTCEKEMISSGNWTDYKTMITRDKWITTTVCDAGQIDGFSYPLLDGSMEVKKPIWNDYLYATVSCSNGKVTLSHLSCEPKIIWDFDIPGIKEWAFVEVSNNSKTLTAQVRCESATSWPRASLLFTYGTHKRVYAVSHKQKELKNTLCNDRYDTLMENVQPLNYSDDWLFIPIHNPGLDAPDYRTSWWGYVHYGETVDLIRCY